MTDEQTTIVQEQSTELAAPNPYSLLQSAIDKGFDAERLGQFLDLQDRVEKKRAEEEYVSAMNRCQQRLPVVVRDAENRQTNSRYARLETVAVAIRPIYTDEGFTLEFGEGTSPLPNHRRIVCDVQHLGGHKKEFHLDSPIDDMGPKGTPNKTQVQGLGAMISYLRRYLTLMIFNVVIADEDNDGNAPDATITEEQVTFLKHLIEECEAFGDPVVMKRFLSMMKVGEEGRVEDIKQSNYEMAKAGLQAKLTKAKKAEVPT